MIEFLEKKFEETDERLKVECELRIEEKQEFSELKHLLETKIKAGLDEVSAMRKINQMMTLQQARARLDSKLALDENTTLYETQLKDKGQLLD